MADAAADAASAAPKADRKAVVTLARLVADAMVEANALTMQLASTPASRVKRAALGPRVAVTGRNAAMHAPKAVESRPRRAAMAVAVVAEEVAESARTVMPAPRRPAAIWQSTRCRRPQRPSSTLNQLWPRPVAIRLTAQKSVKVGAVAVAADAAGVTEIQRVKNNPAVKQAPSPTPRLRRRLTRIWPKALMQGCQLPGMHPTAVSVRGAVAAVVDAIAATAVTARSPARTGKSAAAVSSLPNRKRAIPTLCP